jgi:hypothetical protein
MTGKPEVPGAPRAPERSAAVTRAERQKAALKANMARRKAQARARAEDGVAGDATAQDDQAGGDRRDTSD